MARAVGACSRHRSGRHRSGEIRHLPDHRRAVCGAARARFRNLGCGRCATLHSWGRASVCRTDLSQFEETRNEKNYSTLDRRGARRSRHDRIDSHGGLGPRQSATTATYRKTSTTASRSSAATRSAGVTDGLYTDVWSHNGYAYIGTFQDPCTDAGVFIVDMAAAIANYPDTEGATVAEIKSAPNTRINDVKVHTVGDTDVLITTQEPCGMQIPGWAQSGGNAPFQVGQGGISLYDVTDPTKPKALKKNFLEFEGVHNTFAWDCEGKSYLIGTADTFDFFDTFFVDITKPQSPKLLTRHRCARLDSAGRRTSTSSRPARRRGSSTTTSGWRSSTAFRPRSSRTGTSASSRST